MDKDIQSAVGDEIQQALKKLLAAQNVFTINREDFTSVCATFLYKFKEQLTSGWLQVYFIYDGEFLYFTLEFECCEGHTE